MKARITVNPGERLHSVSRYQYSHFAEHIGRCIYEAMWVGPDSSIPNDRGLRSDVVSALERLHLPALRWPGGCFADVYHWRDGVGPPADRPVRPNIWGGVETNAFGTDEFMRLCAAIGADPYICLNVGSGTPGEASEWIEYCTEKRDTTLARMRAANGHPEPYRVPFWGVGNENWGCGGSMRPAYYADLYRNFATYVRRAGSALIACGSHPGTPDWDEVFLNSLDAGTIRMLDYIALHNYTWVESTLGYTDEQYAQALTNVGGMVEQILKAVALVETRSTPEHPIGVILDEWGLWYRDAEAEDGYSQQSTMLDAVFAAASFHAFHQIPQLFMTNMAQTANVLQALVLTDGPRMLRTPTYHVWEMFMPHRDARVVACESSDISTCATVGGDGTVTLTVVNTDLYEPAELRIEGLEVRRARVLTSESVREHNTFDQPDRIVPRALETPTMPPHSVAVLTLS